MVIEIHDETTGFTVDVKRDSGEVVRTIGYAGCDYFKVDGEAYALYGPAHGFEKFKLFRLIEVAEAK